MTTFEHAMLGVNGALAFGLHRKYGWRVVALAGMAAVAPDWYGIPMLFDMQRFESGHRVWGHNLLSCTLMGILLAATDLRLNVAGWIVRQFAKLAPSNQKPSNEKPPEDSAAADGANEDQIIEFRLPTPTFIWISVAIFGALSQIPADIVVSGGKGLTDWALRPFWPFATTEFVYPLIPWGNIGVTLIFSFAMIAHASRPRLVQPIAILALVLMMGFLASWPWLASL